MFKKYFKEKNILCIYYAFKIEMSEEKIKTKYFRSDKPVWFIFNQLLTKSLYKDRINKFISWYKNHIGKMKEGFLCWLFPLLNELGYILDGEDIDYEKDEKDEKKWNRNRLGMNIIIDDFVVDRHTKAGRGKGLIEFAMCGAFVENEADFVNKLWKSFYDDGKRFDDGEKIIGELRETDDDNFISRTPSKYVSKKVITDDEDDDYNFISRTPSKYVSKKVIADDEDDEDDEKIPLETEEYEFLVLTQITTSGMKQDVYFARDKEGKLVVIKGPYSNKKQIDVLLRNTNWKKDNNIPYILFEVKQMIPNRWPDGIPLGFRNTIDRTKPAWFIIFDSVIPEDKIQKKIHSSKLWPETQVVDWDKIPLHFEYKSGVRTEKEMTDYVRSIFFRYIRGVSDFADRNFLLADGRVISIDEDIEERDVNMYKELRKNKAEYVYKWIKKNYENIDIDNWKGNTSYENEKLKIVKDRKKCLDLFLQ
jgi:hypothetical protein